MKTQKINSQFIEREQRIQDAISLRQPDRVPIALSGMFWVARYAGLTCEQAMYDSTALVDAIRQGLQEFQPDFYRIPHPEVALGPILDKMGYRQLNWPGQEGIDPDVSYQYLDKEYMKSSEYDDYIFDPTGFYLRKFLPRVAEMYEPLARLPALPSSYYLFLAHDTAMYADPDMQKSFKRMTEAGQDALKMFQSLEEAVTEFTEMGFPLCESMLVSSPFDYFADFMRGSKGAMLDMYRNRDKLLEAMDVAARFMVERTLEHAKHTPSNRVFMPMHWGLGGFMSPEQFSTFYWPPLRKVLLQLIENGLTPCVLWEGECNERLETIKDVPPGKCLYAFERTDIFKAKEVLSETVCIRGNVPAPMLTTGTPDEVREYCKKLIDVCGKGGGFIIDGANGGIPDDARPENVKAMFEFTYEYGVYG